MNNRKGYRIADQYAMEFKQDMCLCVGYKSEVKNFRQHGGGRLHKDIHVMDGKIIAPLLESYNAIFNYLPNAEVDSFDVPEKGGARK